jgi:hypothetical protein
MNGGQERLSGRKTGLTRSLALRPRCRQRQLWGSDTDMTVFMTQDSTIAWRLTASYRNLRHAARLVDLDVNALVIEDAAGLAANDAIPASLDCPSYFCDKAQFILILSELVRDGVRFDIALHEIEAGSGTSLAYATLHPRLDERTLALLRSLDPATAAQMTAMNDSIEAVFERLRQQITG